MVKCREIGIGYYMVRMGKRIVKIEKYNIIMNG
jgi:hypothetical protein